MPDSLWPLYSPWNSPGQNSRVGNHSLLQRIFLTQGLNPALPHCRWILYQLNHQESSRILEWVAYPFSRGSSWPRDQTGVSCIAGRFFTSWATRKALLINLRHIYFVAYSHKTNTSRYSFRPQRVVCTVGNKVVIPWFKSSYHLRESIAIIWK